MSTVVGGISGDVPRLGAASLPAPTDLPSLFTEACGNRACNHYLGNPSGYVLVKLFLILVINHRSAGGHDERTQKRWLRRRGEMGKVDFHPSRSRTASVLDQTSKLLPLHATTLLLKIISCAQICFKLKRQSLSPALRQRCHRG